MIKANLAKVKKIYFKAEIILKVPSKINEVGIILRHILVDSWTKERKKSTTVQDKGDQQKEKMSFFFQISLLPHKMKEILL